MRGAVDAFYPHLTASDNRNNSNNNNNNNNNSDNDDNNKSKLITKGLEQETASDLADLLHGFHGLHDLHLHGLLGLHDFRLHGLHDPCGLHSLGSVLCCCLFCVCFNCFVCWSAFVAFARAIAKGKVGKGRGCCLVAVLCLSS